MERQKNNKSIHHQRPRDVVQHENKLQTDIGHAGEYGTQQM